MPLAKQGPKDIPLPLGDAAGPHTVLGGRVGSDGVVYRQSAEFPANTWPKSNGNDVPLSEVHWSDHSRPWDHSNPHQRIFNYDFESNIWRQGPNVPFSLQKP